MRCIDLHTHSLKSDGSMTPTEVVKCASDAGLSAIALSDHDSIAGVKEAVEAGERYGVEIVPAIELSAQSDTETHILGYYIDVDNKYLNERLEYCKLVRDQRQEETCEKLRALGFDVTMEEARALAGADVLCRAHFAKLLVAKGYSPSVKEAFRVYLNNGCPAYSSKQALTDEECVSLIKEAGGVAFLAHLHLTRLPHDELKAFLVRLKGVGLDGIEGYYTDYTPEMQKEYMDMAAELGLAISGGTDFHGAMKPHISIGRGLGSLEIPYSVLEGIKAIANK